MTRRSILAEAGKHLVILLVLAAAFFPLYVMLAISGKSGAQFVAAPFSLTLPFHVENYAAAWGTVSPYVFNTIFICVTAIALTFACSVGAAFFFARYRLPGHGALWYAFLILMLMPHVINLVPAFTLLRDLRLLNTFTALILVFASGGQVIQIYVLRSFIEEIPRELFDAAEVDGAGPLQQIVRIVLPMSGGILSTLAILQFIGIWNNYVLPLVVIRDDALLPLAVGLVRMDSEYVKDWGPLMAGFTIASLPLVLIFLFTMRLFVKGLSAGAVKG